MNNYQIASRAQIATIIPSTNTGVEYDLQKISVSGVTWHSSRFWIEVDNWRAEREVSGETENAVFERFLNTMRDEIPVAIRNAMSAQVSHIMLGMSAETFWGGEEGSARFEKNIRDQIGSIGLTTGANATKMALDNFKIKKVSILTPYPNIGDDNVRQYFSDIGYDVKHIIGLNCPSATAIANTPISEVISAIKNIDGDDVDAIVQCGTNLSTIDLFPALEHWLGKPMIPINVACAWHALRSCNIRDKIIGLGRLFEEF